MGSFFPDLFPASGSDEYTVFDQNPKTSAALKDWIEKKFDDTHAKIDDLYKRMEKRQTNALVESLKQRNEALEAQLTLQTQQLHALSGATAVNTFLDAHNTTLRQRIDTLEHIILKQNQLSPRS